MIYLDTSVIVSYIDELDANHKLARQMIEEHRDDKIVSWLTLVELSSVFSRAGIESPASLALYSINQVRAKLVDIDMNAVLREAFRLSPILKLRSLDLLHISACKLAKCSFFMTLDKGIKSLSSDIQKLGIKVI